jgi:hypothetical protein
VGLRLSHERDDEPAVLDVLDCDVARPDTERIPDLLLDRDLTTLPNL